MFWSKTQESEKAGSCWNQRLWGLVVAWLSQLSDKALAAQARCPSWVRFPMAASLFIFLYFASKNVFIPMWGKSSKHPQTWQILLYYMNHLLIHWIPSFCTPHQHQQYPSNHHKWCQRYCCSRSPLFPPSLMALSHSSAWCHHLCILRQITDDRIIPNLVYLQAYNPLLVWLFNYIVTSIS